MMKLKSISWITRSLLILLCVFLYGCQQKIEVSPTDPPYVHPDSIKPPLLKVFIENSGSMDGYMCDGSQLKDAIYDYVSELNRYTDTTELFYINSTIIPYKGNISEYIKDLNPSSFRQAGGNRANTDLGSIIATILENLSDTTVSVFVSDCILDLPSKNAQKFLTNCEIQIKEVIVSARKKIPNLGVEVLKLTSDFNGKYYYPNGEVEELKDVKRPYYIWIFGDKKWLAQLNKRVPFSMLEKYGLGGVVPFADISDIAYDIQNQYGNGGVIVPRNGEYKARIYADFSTTLQLDGTIQDKSNYEFNNENLIVDGIYPISYENSRYTHFINFSIPEGTRIAQDCLIFYAPKMPLWVVESNDTTGVNISNNLDKTTGIRYLIQGVADAYKTEKVCTKIKFNVKRR